VRVTATIPAAHSASSAAAWCWAKAPACFVLEEYEHARRRAARTILAEFAGCRHGRGGRGDLVLRRRPALGRALVRRT
jgi:hypothetical protein